MGKNAGSDSSRPFMLVPGAAAEGGGGVRVVRLAARVVDRGGEPVARRAVGPVDQGDGERERLDLDALAVHGAEAGGEIEETRLEGPSGGAWGHQDRTAGVRAVHTRPERRAPRFHRRQKALGVEMRVDVDGPRPAHGSRFYYRPEMAYSGGGLAGEGAGGRA